MKHYRKDRNCLNCGKPVADKFCSHCGQENLELKESFWHWLSHIVGHYFHVDGKFIKSIKPLILKPGLLTTEYINGRRAAHFPPVSLYLFISFVFFILVLPGSHGTTKQKPQITTKNGELVAQVPGFTVSVNNKDDTTAAAYEKRQSLLPAEKRDGFVDHYFQKKTLQALEKGDTFQVSFLQLIPKMMFVLLPVYALLLMLFYRKSRHYYIEHLIYTMHVQSFIFLLVLCVILAEKVVSWRYANILMELTTLSWVTWYIYRSMRVVYRNGVFLTAFKMIVLSIAYVALLAISILLAMFGAVAVSTG